MEGRCLDVYFHTTWNYGDEFMTCGYIGVDNLDGEEVVSGMKEYDLRNRLKVIENIQLNNAKYKSLNKFHCGLGCMFFALEDILNKFNEDEIDLLDYDSIVLKNQESYTLDLIFKSNTKNIDISYEKGINNVLKEFSKFYEIKSSLEFYCLKINGKDNVAKKVLDKKLKSLSSKSTKVSKISKSKVYSDLEKEHFCSSDYELKSSFNVLDTMIEFD